MQIANQLCDFKPAWWLNNAHFQTIFPTIFPRNFNLELTRERLELLDTDFLDLDWVGGDSQNVVLILHGLAGSAQSPYIKGIMREISRMGWKGVLMNFRGCSGEPNRLARSYHAGETGDLAFVVQTIKERYPYGKLAIVGYSLGGNVLLKWLGETKVKDIIQGAVAISVPFDLQEAVNRIKTGFSKIYQEWLLKKLKEDLLQKKIFLKTINAHLFQKIKTFEEFDRFITAPLHGFTGENEYYNLCSARQYLKDIRTPTLIIHALNDPFMTPNCIPRGCELSQKVTLELHRSGGHVGFISGSNPLRPIFWLEERVPKYLQNVFI